MKRRQAPTRLRLEHLEDRTVPALLLQLNAAGDLTAILGVPTGDVLLTVTNPDEINVNESGNVLGTYSVSGNLSVRLGNSLLGSFLVLDLNGNSLSGNVAMAAGNSSPFGYLVFVNGPGTIGGNVTLSKGAGFGQVGIGGGFTLGDPSIPGDMVPALPGVTTVQGNVSMSGGDVADDLLLGNSLAPFIGSALIQGNVAAKGGSEFGSVAGDFDVEGSLSWTSALAVVPSTFNGQFTITTTSSVAGNVTVTMPNNGSDTATLQGTILGSAYFNMRGGSNQLDVQATAVIDGSLFYSGANGVDNVGMAAGAQILGNVTAITGGGNDLITLNGTIAGSNVTLNTGNGNDVVTMTTLTAAGARLTALLGNGNDVVNLNATTSTLASLYLDGGFGVDAFNVVGVIAFPTTLRSF